MASQKHATVLMIAHRLETAITYSDKILVMDKGSVAEYDHSFALLMKRPDQYLDGESFNGVNCSAPKKPTRDTLFSRMVSCLPSSEQQRLLDVSH